MSEELEFHNNPLVDDEVEFDSEGSDSVIVNNPSKSNVEIQPATVAFSAAPKPDIPPAIQSVVSPSASASPSASEAKSPNNLTPSGNTKLPSSSPSKKKLAIEFAPLKIPLARRRQTFMVLIFFTFPWILSSILFWALYHFTGIIRYLIILYLGWMLLFQKYSQRGGFRQDWMRNSICWKWFCDFFPMKLHKAADLPVEGKTYIFGFHPHGIISLSAFGNFATNGTGFDQLFPGIKIHLLTLVSNFRIPLYGFYLAALGVCDASRESCNYILRKKQGNSILLVLGGAKESLDAHPGQYILTLKNRKGFVKVGLENGSSLVPVFSFGENDVYDQIANPRGSKLRKWQLKLQKTLGFATPLIKGRGVFNYSYGILPQRKPINTHVGKPIDLPHLSKSEITQEIIDKYHSRYMDELTALFEEHKLKYENAEAKLTFVDDDERL